MTVTSPFVKRECFMSQQSAFDRQNIEEAAVIQPPGLLDQLNLPPAMITFIRKNQRTIWIIVACVTLAVVTTALYKQYSDHREDKAATALTEALQGEGSRKQELLMQVVDEYGSSSSGLWARLELAYMSVENGELDKAIQEYSDVKVGLSEKNPVMPLILYALGALYEKNNELDNAIASFEQLNTYKGFEDSSYEALGRIYEQKGDKVKAVDMYKKALGDGSETNPLQPGNSEQETIQARINYLQD